MRATLLTVLVVAALTACGGSDEKTSPAAPEPGPTAKAVETAEAPTGPPTQAYYVSVFVTPSLRDFFQRSQPGEQITATNFGDGYWLTVSLNIRREDVKEFSEQRVEIELHEWESLLDIVDEEGLLDWWPVMPEIATDQAKLGYVLRGEGWGLQKTWASLTGNDVAPKKLMKAMAELARANASSSPLYILRTGGGFFEPRR